MFKRSAVAMRPFTLLLLHWHRKQVGHGSVSHKFLYGGMQDFARSLEYLAVFASSGYMQLVLAARSGMQLHGMCARGVRVGRQPDSEMHSGRTDSYSRCW